MEGGLKDAIERNVVALARRNGLSAVVATGSDSEMWTQQVCEKYLGKAARIFIDVMPALLITDTSPDRLTESSLRFLVPLRDAQHRFGGVEAFFRALGEFSSSPDSTFLSRFEEKQLSAGKAWSVLELKPNFFGFGINLDVLFARLQGQ